MRANPAHVFPSTVLRKSHAFEDICWPGMRIFFVFLLVTLRNTAGACRRAFDLIRSTQADH
jgi:hypothetical protein